jgi:hypothetical protein
MTTKEYDSIVNYYKSNSNCTRDQLYEFIILKTDSKYKYVDGKESFDESENKISRIIDKVMKYTWK